MREEADAGGGGAEFGAELEEDAALSGGEPAPDGLVKPKFHNDDEW